RGDTIMGRTYANSVLGRPMPNLLLNSSFEFTRTGGTGVTQGSGIGSSGGYSTYFTGPDRWMMRPGGTRSGTISRSNVVPSTDFTNSVRYLDITSAGSRSFQMVQRIEA